MSPVATTEIKYSSRILGEIPKNSEISEGQKSGHLFDASLQSPNALRVTVISSFPGGRWQSASSAYPLPSGEDVPSSVWRYTYA